MHKPLIAIGLGLVLFLLLVRWAALKALKASQSPAPGTPEPRDSRRRTAVHEMGHGIAAYGSRHVQMVIQISLGSDGHGAVLHSRSQRYVPEILWDDLVIKLSGIAAEEAVFGSFYASEAADDLLRAKAIAAELAQAEDIDSRRYDPPWSRDEEQESLYDVQSCLAERLSLRVRYIMNSAYHRALYRVSRQKETIICAAEELRRSGRLDARALEKLLGPRPVLAPGSIPPLPPPSHP